MVQKLILSLLLLFYIKVLCSPKGIGPFFWYSVELSIINILLAVENAQGIISLDYLTEILSVEEMLSQGGATNKSTFLQS